MTIVFKITGTLPAPWEDFLSPDRERYPNITLMTRASANRDGEENSDGSDGWLDRTLDVPTIDEQTARCAIAEAIGVAPGEIVIDQAGVCQSM